VRRLYPGRVAVAGRELRPGGYGRVFTRQGGTWQLAGPALPAALSGQPVQVIRLSQAGGRDVALLQARTGASASLIAAWTGDGRNWQLSQPFGLTGSHAVSAWFGADGTVAVVLSGSRGVTVSGPAAAWHALPPLPPGRPSSSLGPPPAPPTARRAGSMLIAWQLTGQAARWTKTQAIKVPVQYGSSSGS
jgi:hypothetical protein